MSASRESSSRDSHYLSSIPLAPASARTLARLDPYAIQTQSQNDFSSPSTSGHVTPVFPSPYENPSSALFPFTPGPLEIATDAPQPPASPRERMSSPPRPRRPSKPDLAVIFGNPNPPPTGPLPEIPEPGDDSDPASPRSPPLSYRKPVPSFLPTPPRSDPLAVDFARNRSSSPTPSLPGHATTTSRLSVGTFEGLLQKGEAGGETPSSIQVAGYRDEGSASFVSNRLSSLRGESDEPGNVIWSPRIHLGLDERGVEAREERIRQDQWKLQRELEGQDLGEPSQLVRGGPEDRYLSPHTPSPRRGKRKGGGGGDDREIGPVGKRDIPFLSPRYHRGLGYEEAEDHEEVDQSGPVLRRGSKRLSDLEGPAPARSSPELEPSTSARPVQNKRKSRASTLQKLSKRSPPIPQYHRERRDKVARDGNEVEVVVHDSASQDEGDYSDKAGSPVLAGPDEGDWERTRKEATCLSARMNWSFVEFNSWFARFIHLFYPFAMFAHIPATVFLDFCLLYTLVQVALYPAFPAANSALGIFTRRAIIPVPSVAESTGWWVAVGVYAACTAIWLFGVCFWNECGRGYLRRWGGGGGRVQIEKVYVNSASFNYACARSYGTFSFMWQVRLAPLRPKSPLSVAVEGSSRLDFVRETLCWYRQNWPTVLLLVPRAAISVAVLLLYTTTAYGSSMNTGQFASRDSAFFDSATGALTGFAAGVVLTNCAWAALRLVVLVVAWIGLWIIDRPFSCLRRSKRDEAFSSRYQIDHRVQTPSTFGFEEKSFQLNNSLPRLSYGSLPAVDWRARRQRRLRAAILVCLGSTPLSSSSGSFPSPYLRSPYVVGTGSPWSQISGKTKGGPDHKEKVEARACDERRRANLAERGAQTDADSPEVMVSSPPRPQGFWGKVSPFLTPRATFNRSPLISFSRASASPPVGQATGVHSQHRRGNSTSLQEGGDIAESRLHRRVRSVPLQHDDYIHFDEVPLSTRNEPLNETSSEYPRRFSTSPSFPSPPEITTSISNQYPFTAPNFDTRSSDLRLSIPADRPELVSRFSAFSTKPSSAIVTPASPPLPPPVPSRPPSSSGLLEAQLAHIPTEHLKLSDKLLSELRRVESYDRKVGGSDSRRGSELETSSFATARERPASSAPDELDAVDRSLRYSHGSFTSQPDSVGGQSENSTLRGGAVRTPDLSRSLATFAANPAAAAIHEVDDADDDDETRRRRRRANSDGPDSGMTHPSPARPLLPPFRLSSDSRADDLSLGPATPVLGGPTNDEPESGEFSHS
ncbi:hypothetical protein JCM11491_000681 [Sporobolomyces phaffii]